MVGPFAAIGRLCSSSVSSHAEDFSYCFSLSFELFVVSFMQEDVYNRPHCVSAHARFGTVQFDWDHHDG